uniref:Uncharacterized protein n=1 Tax=Tanacetum cinerariifolium TaxID=118510 RepID=A0A6L2LHD5_TANCI|nr:hypothetical protein [Tanacetum cinerariifolium]
MLHPSENRTLDLPYGSQAGYHIASVTYSFLFPIFTSAKVIVEGIFTPKVLPLIASQVLAFASPSTQFVIGTGLLTISVLVDACSLVFDPHASTLTFDPHASTLALEDALNACASANIHALAFSISFQEEVLYESELLLSELLSKFTTMISASKIKISDMIQNEKIEDKIKEGTLKVDHDTDAMTVVLRMEKGGYARGVGSGVTYKRYFDLPRIRQASDERVLLLQS